MAAGSPRDRNSGPEPGGSRGRPAHQPKDKSAKLVYRDKPIVAVDPVRIRGIVTQVSRP